MNWKNLFKKFKNKKQKEEWYWQPGKGPIRDKWGRPLGNIVITKTSNGLKISIPPGIKIKKVKK